MTKIVVIINNLGVGGAERLAVDDINEMIKRGQTVKLVTLKPEKDIGTLSIQCDIKASDWVCIKFQSLYDFESWKKLVAFLRDFKPDAVITHLWYANSIGRIAAHWAGVKKIISFEHSVYDGVKTWKQFWLDRFLQKWTTSIIAVSGAVKNSLLKNGIKNDKIELLLNGIDLNKYKILPPPKLRAELNLKQSDFVYIFIGRLMPSKGVDLLVDAFKKIPDAVLLVVGEGKERYELEQLTANLNLSDRVKFLGNRSDIPELLAISDCFVLPSRHEGLPMVLLEAMAAGKPIIITNFQASGEVINNGLNGIIVPIGDVVQLTAALDRVRNDNDFRSKLGQGAEISSGKYSIECHIDAILNLIK